MNSGGNSISGFGIAESVREIERIKEVSIELAFPETLVLHDFLVERDRGSDAFHDKLIQRPVHLVYRLFPGRRESYQLRQKRVVIRRNLVADVRV